LNVNEVEKRRARGMTVEGWMGNVGAGSWEGGMQQINMRARPRK
jgi:hypothetical protein